MSWRRPRSSAPQATIHSLVLQASTIYLATSRRLNSPGFVQPSYAARACIFHVKRGHKGNEHSPNPTHGLISLTSTAAVPGLSLAERPSREASLTGTHTPYFKLVPGTSRPPANRCKGRGQRSRTLLCVCGALRATLEASRGRPLHSAPLSLSRRCPSL